MAKRIRKRKYVYRQRAQEQKQYLQLPYVKAKRREHSKNQRYKRKLQALKAYSGEHPRCMCECGCKENKLVYLDLDHVNNDGAKHRREISKMFGSSKGSKFYLALRKLGWPHDPPIRVLCVKCNIGRYRNGGRCPELDDEDLFKCLS